MISSFFADVCARLILSTRAIDKAYRLFDKIRSELVLAAGTDAVFDRFNDLSYGDTDSYRPDSSGFRKYLFPWEEQVVDKFFPPPPARILIGGAGGGREVFALASRGYQIVAFEPSKALVESMSAYISKEMSVEVFRASYEDLPQMFSNKLEKPTVNVEEMPTFDAAIIGWGSFSHLKTKEKRVQTLNAFARVTKGPIAVSFLSFRQDAKEVPKKPKLRRFIPGYFNQEPGNAFSVYIGFYHEMYENEMIDVAQQAGLKIIHLNSDSRETNWPHAVLIVSET